MRWPKAQQLIKIYTRAKSITKLFHHNLKMKHQTPNLEIGLLDNSCHSLKRGYEMWSLWKNKNDGWLLKESVIWIHHGIELALKQLLVQTNEFLVFENVDRAVERLGILRRKKGMKDAGVLNLFENDERAISVGFKNLIERTAITLSIPELNENQFLRIKIDELTKYRNKMVHFSVKIDVNELSNLLSDILDPFLELLEREIKDLNFKNKCMPEIRKAAIPVIKFSKERYQEAEIRVEKILNQFNGQKISGSLFGKIDEIILPKFAGVCINRKQTNDTSVDLIGQNENEPWRVVVKFGRFGTVSMRYLISQLRYIQKHHTSSKVWLIVMNENSHKVPTKDKEIFMSSIKDLEKLEDILFLKS